MQVLPFGEARPAGHGSAGRSLVSEPWSDSYDRSRGFWHPSLTWFTAYYNTLPLTLLCYCTSLSFSTNKTPWGQWLCFAQCCAFTVRIREGVEHLKDTHDQLSTLNTCFKSFISVLQRSAEKEQTVSFTIILFYFFGSGASNKNLWNV